MLLTDLHLWPHALGYQENFITPAEALELTGIEVTRLRVFSLLDRTPASSSSLSPSSPSHPSSRHQITRSLAAQIATPDSLGASRYTYHERSSSQAQCRAARFRSRGTCGLLLVVKPTRNEELLCRSQTGQKREPGE
nr:hypothetical protein CFP56_12912 [Quercus suber]